MFEVMLGKQSEDVQKAQAMLTAKTTDKTKH